MTAEGQHSAQPLKFQLSNEADMELMNTQDNNGGVGVSGTRSSASLGGIHITLGEEDDDDDDNMCTVRKKNGHLKVQLTSTGSDTMTLSDMDISTGTSTAESVFEFPDDGDHVTDRKVFVRKMQSTKSLSVNPQQVEPMPLMGRRSHGGRVLMRHRSEGSGLMPDTDPDNPEAFSDRHITCLIRKFERMSGAQRSNTMQEYARDSSEDRSDKVGGRHRELTISMEPDGERSARSVPDSTCIEQNEKLKMDNKGENNNSWNMGYKRKTCIVKLDGCKYTIGE